MASPSQKERFVAVSSPLGEDVLLLQRMTAVEELGQLFQFDLDLLSDQGDIKFEDLLGQRMTVRLNVPPDGVRYFNGHVCSFEQTGRDGAFYVYRATLRPWLWFLTRTADCRIFPDKSKSKKAKAPDIIMEVFREHGFSDFEDKLNEEYKEWEHCVQYRETDFNFVMRLMEQEGIYYFFKHEKDKHILVLCDAHGSHETVKNYDEIRYYPPGDDEARDVDHIFDWKTVKTVQPGLYALKDYDFMRPRANLEFKATVSRDHAGSEFEVFDYPGDFVEPADGELEDKSGNDKLAQAYEKFAKNRIEELHAQYEMVSGAGNARGMTAGALFKLVGYDREDQDREYLTQSVTHLVQSDEYTSGGSSFGDVYECSFVAIDSQRPYRLPRTTPKPSIQGPQTAIVAGKKGEEIWTDKYGRVRVQFPWDRYSQADETSSCWVRVAQVWAGKKWGGIHIPRIGQEVVVEFLEGDPDRPIITGSVYNGDNMPPYDLPDFATISGVKSNSSKGGGGCNEIRFEDKAGEEQVFIHAQFDQHQRVENDELEWVGNERHLIVTANQLEKVDADKHLTVAGDQNEKVDGTISREAGSDIQEKVGSNYAMDAGSEVHLKAGSSLIIEAGSQLTLSVGGNFVVIDSSGVAISGSQVKINSGGSAGSGSGSSPSPPEEPLAAIEAEPGEIAEPPQKPAPPEPTEFSPAAMVLQQAAQDGTPLCPT